MTRVVAFFALSLALLGVVRSARPTCADESEFTRFSATPALMDLADENGDLLGTLELMSVRRANTNCFRAIFEVIESAELLKLRVGIFSSADESEPTGKNRFTRRKNVSNSNVRRAEMNICPSSIVVEQPGSCCGEVSFDLYAFALISLRGNAMRAYMRERPDGAYPCRVPDAKKPFRQVCTLQASCITCGDNECRLEDGESCISVDAWESSCEPNAAAAVDPATGACACADLDCNPQTECFMDHTCVNANKPCAPEKVLQADPVTGECICEDLICDTETECVHDFTCVTLQAFSEFCPRDSIAAVDVSGSDCTCTPVLECPPNICRADTDGDSIVDSCAQEFPFPCSSNTTFFRNPFNHHCACLRGCSDCPPGFVARAILSLEFETCECRDLRL
mmetsp:Transcript_16113/g.23417  ORF Transcript_16113/g.23417 Transcript_16113/m.23417 type:complete len:395 (-) Transcript_16113:166-1350(-)